MQTIDPVQTSGVQCKRLTGCRERADLHVPLGHDRHWLCTAANSFSAPIEAPVSADNIPSPERGSRYAATRVHDAAWRRGGVAAYSARAATDDARAWIYERAVAGGGGLRPCCVSSGTWAGRLFRRQECCN